MVADHQSEGAEALRVVSVNVGQPREATWKRKRFQTGIFKGPVTGRTALRRLNLDGDRQADLSVHGGPSKAVYAYPFEHYAAWRAELSRDDLPPGTFGENLTVAGLAEGTVCIGDHFRVGTAELIVTHPRMPCFKLDMKMDHDGFGKLFLASGRTGFYLAVLREGAVGAGDAITLVARDPHGVTVEEVARLHEPGRHSPDVLRRAAAVEALPTRWRDRFRAQADALEARQTADES